MAVAVSTADDGSSQRRKLATGGADGIIGQSAFGCLTAARPGLVDTSDKVVIDTDALREKDPGFLPDTLALPNGQASGQASGGKSRCAVGLEAALAYFFSGPIT